MFSRYVARMSASTTPVTVSIPNTGTRFAFLAFGPAHTAGAAWVRRGASAFTYPEADTNNTASWDRDQPLVLTPGAPLAFPFHGPIELSCYGGTVAETATEWAVHPVVDIVCCDNMAALPAFVKRAPFYWNGRSTALYITQNTAITLPTYYRRTVKLVLTNAGGVASSTSIHTGLPSGLPFVLGGNTFSNARLQKTFALAAGATAVLQWGDGFAPAPDTPAAGENGAVPSFLRISEANNTSIAVCCEAYD